MVATEDLNKGLVILEDLVAISLRFDLGLYKFVHVGFEDELCS